MKNNKLVTTAGILDQIAKICNGLFQAAVIVLLIFSVLVLILGEQMYMSGSVTAELGFVELQLAPEYQGITAMTKAYTIVSLLCGCVVCAMFSCVCSLLRQILAPMKEGRPFEKSVPADLRKIAWITLIGGGLNEVLEFIQQQFVIRSLPMDKLFSSDAVIGTVYHFKFDTGFVFVFFLTMFLSYIFSYGQTLQKEADDTV